MEEHGPTVQAPAMETQGLTKSFGNRLVLGGIDLVVERGEFVVIFGPNGAGKTTLIKILATIMNPSSGRILVDGLNLKDNAEEIRRRIGVVTHQTFLYSNLTAFENLEFYSRMYDVPIVILSISLWRTQHPEPLIFQGGLAPPMLLTLMVSLAAFTVLYHLLLTQRVAMKKAEGEIKRLKDYDSWRAN